MQPKKPAPKKNASKPARKASPRKTPEKKPASRSGAKKAPRKKRPTGGKVGHPSINDPNDAPTIEGKIAVYFENVAAAEERPTFCGLALALGYSSRTSLWNNAKGDAPIAEPIKKACLKIEESYEKGLRGVACTGSIFALKNRGWTDKPEDEQKDDTIAKLAAIAERLTGGNR
jgi:hypothetical protein